MNIEENMPILNIILIIGVVALVLSFFTARRSAIWGAATLGLIAGVVFGVIKSDFSDILRFILIGAVIGLCANILGWISDRMRGIH